VTGQPVSVDLRVRYAETDQMGVVYHSHYLVWCEVGRTELLRRLGTDYAAVERAGTSLAVAEATLRYHAPARYDDRIRVETTLVSVRSRILTFDYLITNADTGERLVTARTALIALNDDGKPRALSADLRRALEGYM
jgi:acyl-CoA thioester hydrolase